MLSLEYMSSLFLKFSVGFFHFFFSFFVFTSLNMCCFMLDKTNFPLRTFQYSKTIRTRCRYQGLKSKIYHQPLQPKVKNHFILSITLCCICIRDTDSYKDLLFRGFYRIKSRVNIDFNSREPVQHELTKWAKRVGHVSGIMNVTSFVTLLYYEAVLPGKKNK